MWEISNNILHKEVGELTYQVICKLPLETWYAYRCEGGLVMVELASGKLETCLKVCNQDSKQNSE